MSLRIGRKRTEFSFALFIFCIIYLVFSVLDLAASAQTGHKGADRSAVHIAILSVTVFLFLYFIFNLRFVKTRSLKLIGIFTALLFWTSTVNILKGTSTWNLLIQENMSFLWILICYFFESIRLKCATNKPIKSFAMLFFVFFIGSTVYYFYDMYIRLGEIPVLNVIYCVIALLPWLFVDNNRSKRNDILIFTVVVAVTLLSMKRGAIIAVVLMILTYYFVQAFFNKNYKSIGKLLVFTIILIIAFNVADNISGGFLSARFSEEEMASGSGRTEQFAAVISILKESNLISLLFGYGSQKGLDIFGTGIHNEWLAFFFNYGFIGLILYAMMFLYFFKQSRIIRKTNKNLAVPCYMMSVFYFVLSMVSTGYGGYVGILLFGFWGFVNAEHKISCVEK